MKTTCAFCEHFDGGGLAKVTRARLGLLIIQGDCHNAQSPRFTTASDDTCGQFLLSEDLAALAGEARK